MNDIEFDEELNLKLYNKLLWEFERYKEKLLTMSPEEILKHAYEYVMYEEIVCVYNLFAVCFFTSVCGYGCFRGNAGVDVYW